MLYNYNRDEILSALQILMPDYSTKKLSEKLFQEIREALLGLDYGSIEIFVADSMVTQITRRQIKKTSGRK